MMNSKVSKIKVFRRDRILSISGFEKELSNDTRLFLHRTGTGLYGLQMKMILSRAISYGKAGMTMLRVQRSTRNTVTKL
jgi:hypothetical protein